MDQTKRRQQAKTIRIYRKIHRLTGICLFVFFFILGLSGLILGWKKNSSGYLLAKSYQGTSTDLKLWLSVDSLQHLSQHYLIQEWGTEISTSIDRIDMRPDKGMVKFIFKENFNAVQLDAATGKLLHMEKRRADFIEQIHDGTIVDKWLGLKSGQFKLFYTTIMGLALITFTISGFWLWYGPKRMQRFSESD
jgi:uncharacterized iron-regulated membrane protein